MIRRLHDEDAATLLRRGVLALAGFALAGTALELLFVHHWESTAQLIVWPALVTLGLGLTMPVARPSPGRVRWTRAIALAVGMVALVSVGFHVNENLTAGPLDRDYAGHWSSLSVPEQWWTAITGGVGPAPTLAPGVLAQIALSLVLATVRHPALTRQHRSSNIDLQRLAQDRPMEKEEE